MSNKNGGLKTRLKTPVYGPKCPVFVWSAKSHVLTIWISDTQRLVFRWIRYLNVWYSDGHCSQSESGNLLTTRFLILFQERRRDEARVRDETRRRDYESESVLSNVQHEMERPRGGGSSSTNNGTHNRNGNHKNQSKNLTGQKYSWDLNDGNIWIPNTWMPDSSEYWTVWVSDIQMVKSHDLGDIRIQDILDHK